ncbi:hypothetical protein B0H13DRAFT_1583350, partial [Mycena leptocephala]
PPSLEYTRRNTALPLPLPVPNLTKTSCGRRVPADAPHTLGKVRTFLCSVCRLQESFMRSEHLKRHVRITEFYFSSLTAHKCPYKGCGRPFSRRDNLAQHSRVH